MRPTTIYELLEQIDGSNVSYCIECYSKEELCALQTILGSYGYASHIPSPGVFDSNHIAVVSLWVRGDDKRNITWSDGTYADYDAWYFSQYGCHDKSAIEAVLRFADIREEKTPDTVDAVDDPYFDAFLANMR